MTVQGMMQHEQSSVERQLHLPGWGLTTEPADEEMVEAGILTGVEDRKAIIGCRIAWAIGDSWTRAGAKRVLLRQG